MTILHIINQSPLDSDSLKRCLSLFGETSQTVADSILLIEEGVYGLLKKDLPTHIKLYALKADVEARGLTCQHAFVTFIDANEFVDLTISHDKSLTW